MPIDGVKVTDITLHIDDRGSLFQAAGGKWIQRVYIVTDPVRGTVRGFHRHMEESEVFCIISGSAKFVLIDPSDPPRVTIADCAGGTPFLPTPDVQIDEYTLSAARLQTITIPAGVYHGWVSLEDNTVLVAVADRPYNPADKECLPADAFGDLWTVRAR